MRSQTMRILIRLQYEYAPGPITQLAAYRIVSLAGLPPNVEVNRIELTLLYNYIYSDLLKTRNLEMTRAVTSSYTQATRVLYRGK